MHTETTVLQAQVVILMVGKYQVQLGADQLISGMSSSDFATDGALGISTYGINPYVKPGTIYAMATSVDISTNVAGQIIATCEDSNATSPNNRYMVDDASGAANYYLDNGTAITKVRTGSATYIKGKSDMVSFNGNFYATTATTLVLWDGSGGGTLNESYQTFNDGNALHPMIAYNGFLYVADGNTISTLTTGGTYTTNVLVLQSKEKIVALGIDPSTGLMLVSVQTVYDVSDTIPSLKAVYLYDGISAKPVRKILVDDLVTAFYNVQGTVFVGAGQTLGVWNGNGVTFLRKLQNVTLSNLDLPYKHNFTNIGRILHLVDGNVILSYGPTISGKNGFFYTAFNPSGSPGAGKLYCVYPRGSNRVAVSYTTNKLSSFDFSSVASGASGTLYFNNIYFPRPIFIHRMRVITTGIAFTGGTDMVVNIFDEKGNVIPISNANRIVSVPAGTTYVKDFDFGGGKCQSAQPVISISSGNNYGIVRVYLYYDIAE